ncbi:hypothetical protein WT88_29660 [Burkholderia stagnalis]|uniref:hypothetical protein n=1 Tax=Burkholderia stagnalis TaxID=1503054 RepID=UPI000757794C|nr:hypothetical protein [Burkholderia stagnalis]KVZ18649.1 hypothetical protein WT35_04600 [Burkholderia stagnalis]KWN32872.1 hypothetical protein WT86_18725 [Burkholderia stagnalis]KWN44699.1 hypothetical protein WT88_29660 [Burkholderia stagnalis]KWN54432.1 hypothetical protein WT87_03755 [Burkholderia stagnalis]KWO68839.1 hypothetical protein WT99_21125 [Burkholderia stagnalis]
MDSTAIAEIGCAVLALLGSVFAYLWRRSESQRDDTIKAHGEAIDDLSKELSKSDKKHGDELAAYKLHVAETYVTSNALSSSIDAINRAIEAIFKKLERIDDKLDNKADK